MRGLMDFSSAHRSAGSDVAAGGYTTTEEFQQSLLAPPIPMPMTPADAVDLGTLPRGQAKWWERPGKAIIAAGLLLLVGYAIYSGAVWTSSRRFFQPGLHTSFWFSMTGYAVIMYIALVWRIVLWLRYKPMESVSDADLPNVSVIIPAYNEGALVRQSILSVARNEYPREKLQVLVIDDGSSDDTWDHIQTAVAELQSSMNITASRQPRNMGKRAALYAGFQKATGDVIVTMDSDSIFEPRALRNAVTPIVRDPKIACVAGCVEVLNPFDSIWTRFLRTTFSLSFKFVRAYQSEFRGVFCTPGALSVYRADVVRKVADEWLNQKFLGQECKTGEDRAMTNLILREGWLTAYQENAKVWAEMPTDYVGTTKMLLRWARSNIRETIVLQRFMFTPFRKEHLTAFRINMLLVLSTLIVPYLLIANSLALIALHPEYIARHLSLVAVFGLTQAAIYYKKEKDSDWLWLMFYELFWVIGFVWIMPYAALTLRNTGWLTRGANKPRQASSAYTSATAAVPAIAKPLAVTAMSAAAAALPTAMTVVDAAKAGT